MDAASPTSGVCAAARFGRKMIESQSPPGGDAQTRPSRPLPAVCCSATMTVPSAAPASASRRASSLVEGSVSYQRTSCPIVPASASSQRQTEPRSELAASNESTAVPSGSRSPGATSASGTSTNARRARSAWGTVRSGSRMVESPYNKMSTSTVRGSHRSLRTRPSAASTARHRPSSAFGESVVSTASTWLRYIAWPVTPQGTVSYTPDRPVTRRSGVSRPRTASRRYPARSPTFEPRPRNARTITARRAASISWLPAAGYFDGGALERPAEPHVRFAHAHRHRLHAVDAEQRVRDRLRGGLEQMVTCPGHRIPDARVEVAVVERIREIVGVPGAVQGGLDRDVHGEHLPALLLLRAHAVVGVEGEPGQHDAVAHGRPRTIASVIRATRTIARTSCTRTKSAPLAIAITIVAAVPSIN